MTLIRTIKIYFYFKKVCNFLLGKKNVEEEIEIFQNLVQKKNEKSKR